MQQYYSPLQSPNSQMKTNSSHSPFINIEQSYNLGTIPEVYDSQYPSLIESKINKYRIQDASIANIEAFPLLDIVDRTQNMSASSEDSPRHSRPVASPSSPPPTQILPTSSSILPSSFVPLNFPPSSKIPSPSPIVPPHQSLPQISPIQSAVKPPSSLLPTSAIPPSSYLDRVFGEPQMEILLDSEFSKGIPKSSGQNMIETNSAFMSHPVKRSEIINPFSNVESGASVELSLLKQLSNDPKFVNVQSHFLKQISGGGGKLSEGGNPIEEITKESEKHQTPIREKDSQDHQTTSKKNIKIKTGLKYHSGTKEKPKLDKEDMDYERKTRELYFEAPPKPPSKMDESIQTFGLKIEEFPNLKKFNPIPETIHLGSMKSLNSFSSLDEKEKEHSFKNPPSIDDIEIRQIQREERKEKTFPSKAIPFSEVADKVQFQRKKMESPSKELDLAELNKVFELDKAFDKKYKKNFSPSAQKLQQEKLILICMDCELTLLVKDCDAHYQKCSGEENCRKSSKWTNQNNAEIKILNEQMQEIVIAYNNKIDQFKKSSSFKQSILTIVEESLILFKEAIRIQVFFLITKKLRKIDLLLKHLESDEDNKFYFDFCSLISRLYYLCKEKSFKLKFVLLNPDKNENLDPMEYSMVYLADNTLKNLPINNTVDYCNKVLEQLNLIKNKPNFLGRNPFPTPIPLPSMGSKALKVDANPLPKTAQKLAVTPSKTMNPKEIKEGIKGDITSTKNTQIKSKEKFNKGDEKIEEIYLNSFEDENKKREFFSIALGLKLELGAGAEVMVADLYKQSEEEMVKRDKWKEWLEMKIKMLKI